MARPRRIASLWVFCFCLDKQQITTYLVAGHAVFVPDPIAGVAVVAAGVLYVMLAFNCWYFCSTSRAKQQQSGHCGGNFQKLI